MVRLSEPDLILSPLIRRHCLGIIQARRIVSGALVTVGPKAQIKGDLTAPRVAIQLGARVNGGRFAVPDDPLELTDLPRRTR